MRAIAMALLLGLPAVAGARLAIDVLAASASEERVESRHASGCAWHHDHRVCLLAQQVSLGSTGSSSANFPAPPDRRKLGPQRRALAPRSPALTLGPRAPPTLV